MTKRNVIMLSVAAILVVALVVAAVVLLSGSDTGTKPDAPQQTTTPIGAPNDPTAQSTGTGSTSEKQLHTVCVVDELETPLADIGVYVYTDEAMDELVWFDTTDEQGIMTFEEVPSDTFVAVLSDVPEEYTAEEFYPLTGLETKLTLAGYKDPVYALGMKMQDFTVVDSDGNEHSLYALLAEKKAVVLNFWYINCGPCGMEFPFMNEAYQEFREKLEILAVSPIDVNADISNYKANNSLSFPMAECEAKWEDMMQLDAYPTTVVVDRNGIISFIHKGYIDNVEDFRNLFHFFTTDEYEPTLVKSLEELPEAPVEEKGTQENPFEIGGVTSFEITVKAGEKFYVNLYKAPKMWMQISATDLTVTYNEKDYVSKNGSVGLLVNTPDMNSFVPLVFTNNSKEDKTYTVNLSALPGSFNNPYPLEVGDVTVEIGAGNEQGVYYLFKAKEDGELALTCTGAPAISYDCTLNRVMAGDVVVVKSLSVDGENNCVKTLVKAGETVKVNFATLPDSNNNYPGGTFYYKVEFTAGEVEEDEKDKELDYLVTVTDEENKGIANVNLSVFVDEVEKPFATNGEGVATIRLPKGTYTVKVTVPGGYTLETTEYMLTEEQPAVTVVLQTVKVEMVDYQVKVENVYAEPVVGVMIRIGTQMIATDENGIAKANLEKGEYTATVMTVPEGFVKPAAITLPADGAEQIITLEYQAGSQYAPIEISETPYTTQSISAGTGLYYNLRNAGGMILHIADKNAAVIYNGTTYGANTQGNIRIELEKPMMPMMPITIQLHNVGSVPKAFTLELSHPVGSYMNPQVLDQLTDLETVLAENDEDGYYYSWTANETGTARFSLVSASNGACAEIVANNLTASVNKTLSADGADLDGRKTIELEVSLGDAILFQIIANPFNENEEYVGQPATTIATANALITAPVDTRINYTVKVVDSEGNPWTGTVVTFKKGSLTVGEPQTTDAAGEVTTLMEPGDYTFELTLPDDSMIYDAAQCVLTEAAPSRTVILEPKPDTTMDFTVNITKDGAAYTGDVTVQLFSGTTVISEGKAVDGTYTARLEADTYTVQLVLSDDTLEYTAATVTKEAPTADIALTKKAPVIQNITYTVKVVDSKGTPQAGVWVEIKDTEYLGQTGAEGVFTQVMPSGNYSVELLFTGTSYYYNTTAAVLTAAVPNLTITLAAEPSSTDTTPNWFINDAEMFNIYEGTTHLPLGTDKPYYSAEQGNRCFFVFLPNRGGNYRLSLDRTDVALVGYGTTNWPFAGDSSADSEDGAIYINAYDDSIGNYGFVLGVDVVSGMTDVAVTVTRVGDPGFRIDLVPYDEAWKSDYVPTKFTLPAGSKLSYVDVMGATEAVTVVYNETDGFYHWGSANGPVMYVNLGPNAPYFSLQKVINGDGAAGGAPIRAYFYDENGTFLKKEDYTQTVTDYLACVDTATGVYPLTQDLAYILQNGCKGWWTATDPGYGMSALNGSNPEIAWLFACCYIA